MFDVSVRGDPPKLDKKKVENRLDRVKELVARGIWKPIQSGANP
jgi:hypothetical protein